MDDPSTPGLDLGEQISLVNGITVPTSSDLATRLLRTFFIATHPANWIDYTSTAPWHITYPGDDTSPGVTVRITGGAEVNLAAVLNTRYGNDVAKAALSDPTTAAVGEVWVDTQFEKTAGKTKPGTATAIDGHSWKATRKVALPNINMNNPHNMWTDRNQTLIYQTQWFDSKLAVFNRTTGAFVNNISVGESPAHVMTRTDTDQLHVTLNGSTNNDSVVELAPMANGVEGHINIGRGNPHAHWMGHDGKLMVTPNALSADSTQYNFATGSIDKIVPAGVIPIAVGMTPDSKTSYVASLLDSTITVINTQDPHAAPTTINLLGDYNPDTGTVSLDPVTGVPFVGALPIQTPVSPDGKAMVTANTLTGTITIVDTKPGSPTQNQVVRVLGCDPGCHGVQFGAKAGGGYYAYVASKFSNSLIVVDVSGDAADANIAGRVLLTSATDSTTATDFGAAITGNHGMGGQGILPIPVVYNGWVQNLPDSWKNLLTDAQKNPIGQ